MPLDKPSRSRRRRRLVSRLPMALLSVALLGPGAWAEPIEMSFGVASATVQRGIAIGVGGIDAHAAAHYAHPNGWRASLGATALHSRPSQRPQWDAQWFGRLGYAHRLDEDWSGQLAFARYAYSGSALLRRYAHDEVGATLAYRDLLYLSIAGLRRSHGGNGSVAYDLVVRQTLPFALSASAGLGHLNSDGDVGYAYNYGHLGLGAQWGITQAQLSYIATSAAAKRRYGAAAANRWTASLDWRF